MPERTEGAVWAAVAGAIGLCCAFPLLATFGLLGFVAGVSLGSWLGLGLGLGAAVAAVGIWKVHGRRGGTS